MGTRKDVAERNDRTLLQAARDVLAEDGAHASVAAIAARAGVGIGSLYRRYKTKEELFQRLTLVSLDHWNEAAEQGLADPDPWAGLAAFVRGCVEFGQGSLAPIAGAIEVTPGDERQVPPRRRAARRAGRRRTRPASSAPMSAVDISLLIEQLGRSPWSISFASKAGTTCSRRRRRLADG